MEGRAEEMSKAPDSNEKETTGKDDAGNGDVHEKGWRRRENIRQAAISAKLNKPPGCTVL